MRTALYPTKIYTGSRGLAILVIVGLAAGLSGCQGVSAGKSQSSVSGGQLAVGVSSISFGNVQIGTTQTKTDTVTNVGGSSLTVTQMTVAGTGFSISGVTVPLTLAAGQSASYSVVFAPKTAGSASGSIAISTDSGTTNATLAGTGVARGNLATTPTSFSFGQVLAGRTSSQTETLKNTGDTDLTITAVKVTGAGFGYAGLSLPLTLAPKQASTFRIHFAPTNAGPSSGDLALTVSGATTSVDVALSGAGALSATLTATPIALTFTNVQVGQSSTQTETVTNTGGSNTQISQVTASGTGYSVAGITTPVTLTPGQSVSFSVTFTPQSAGNFNGTVSITSDASNPNLSLSLSGSAVAATQNTLSLSPNPINVGNVVFGQSGTQSGTLTATGGSVVVSSVSIGGANPNEFSISGLSFPLTVNASQPVSFTVEFTPGATGTASATASFVSNASNSPASATLTGTGTSAPVHTVTLSWNASTSPNISGYNIYRAVYKSSCGSYSKINGSTLDPATTYTDNSVTDGTNYCYATTTVNSSNEESGYSNIVFPVQIPAP